MIFFQAPQILLAALPNADKEFVEQLLCRELAFQISEQFEALGSLIGIRCGKLLLV